MVRYAQSRRCAALNEPSHCVANTIIEQNSMTDIPNLVEEFFDQPTLDKLQPSQRSTHPPRILLLYGSLREQSFSRFAIEEAQRLLEKMGCETKVFNPKGLPIVDPEHEKHPKVLELLELMEWSEGQVWCSPERHGSITGIMKTQIDWVPLSIGSVRPTQGKTLAVMQVEGVDSVEARYFRRRGGTSVTSLADGVLTFGRLEIPRLENSPSFPERGALDIEMGRAK